MKKGIKRKVALGLCAAVMLSGMQAPALMVGAAQEKEEPQSSVSKEETVYILTEADGSMQDVIVSDWLKNPQKADTISERSDLTEVENVKGDETYTDEAGHVRVWNAGGKDIYYQGRSEQTPPIALSVSYELDGKPILPQELAGKSGKVRIRFTYTNSQYETVDIDGKKERVCVPFAVLTGMILDDEVFHNVEVIGGKLVNDGSRTAVVGIAFPGIQESLQLPEQAAGLPSTLEITADVENFAMGMTLSIATNEVFNQIDIQQLDSIEDLKGSLQKLTDAMDQLINGSSDLREGLRTLSEKSGTLANGVDRLTSGASAIHSGMKELASGAEKLYEGASRLQEGLDTLVSNSSQLTAGAAQVFRTLLDTAAAQLQEAGLSVPAMTIENYADVLNGIINSLDEAAVYQQALSQVTAAVEANRAQIIAAVQDTVKETIRAKVCEAAEQTVTEQVTQTVYETVKDQVILAATGLDRAAYEAAVSAGSITEEQQSQIASAAEAQMQTEDVQQKIAVAVQQQMASEEAKAMIEGQIAAQLQSDEVQSLIALQTEAQVQKLIADNMASDAVQSQLAAASEGAKAVIALKSSLDSYHAFYLGLYAYTAGVAEAATGAGELKTGAESLKTGAGALNQGTGELYNGLVTLQDSVPALLSGISQLLNGSARLADGIKELNEKGIEKLIGALDDPEKVGDVSLLLKRIKAGLELSKEYQSFSEIDEKMEGKVKFIYRTEGIEIKKES
ncbi:MAG: hypothetical protein HFE64_02950 [Lachnospiraceae bacterium]|jgi:putative membrane protein|nr:hypothetical protein [Lachnospiraceae bacterium]